MFFIQTAGFVATTEARRIAFEDALRFEAVHIETYRRFGYRPVIVAPGTPRERADAIKGLATVMI